MLGAILTYRKSRCCLGGYIPVNLLWKFDHGQGVRKRIELYSSLHVETEDNEIWGLGP
jgi:hypothetical protein